MSHSIWNMIAETPWWMYVLIFALAKLAYLSTKSRIIALKPLINFNCIYIAILFLSLFAFPESTVQNISLTAIGLSLGIFLGWLHYRFSGIKIIKPTLQIHMPGSWLLCIILPFVFFAKYYYFGGNVTTNLFYLFNHEKFAAAIYSLTGLVIGLTIGRTYYLLRCLSR